MNFVRAQKKLYVILITLMQLFHLTLLKQKDTNQRRKHYLNFAKTACPFKDKKSAYLRAHISLWSWWPIRA